MQFVITQVLYNVGADPVTIVAKNPFGGLTNIDTTQSALDAERADLSRPWGDDELLAVATAALPALFPDVAGLTSALYEAPAPIAP